MKITENIENTIVPNDTKLIKNENKNLQELKIQILEEENKLLLKTNNMLLKELRDSKDKYNTIYEEYLLRIDECNKLFGEVMDIKQEIRRLKNPNSCGMCITCIGCKQAVPEEELAIEKSIADSEAYYNRTWNLACGDDF